MEIIIKEKKEISNGWCFSVNIGENNFIVELDKKYWQKIMNGKINPEVLIKKSFQFLLKKEPKEAILKKFNLKIISSYFPDYEKYIIMLCK